MKLFLIFALCVTVAVALKPSLSKRDVFGRALGYPEGRVVGGWDATPHSAPYICSIKWVVITAGSHLCGASIYTNEWIITAAHCLDAVPNIGAIEVVAGRHNIGLATEPFEQRRNADYQIGHPDYQGDVNPFDIGLIHVTVPFTYTPQVNTVSLPIPGMIHAGSAQLYGWGSTSTTALPIMPDILQTVTKEIVPIPQCEAAFGGPGASPLHETNLCTGPLTGGISACSGDSGGPLIVGTNELIGVVSWGVIPCGTIGAPSVFVRVSAFNAWLHSVIDNF